MSEVIERITRPLAALATALDGHGVTWRLGGSGLLAALGLTDQVGDLDVMVAAEDIDDVTAACCDWVVEVETGRPPAPWCNDWLARLDVDGTPADVIGGLCVVAPSGRVVVPLDLGGHLDVAGVAVPLADPAVWWWVYRAYKPAKAALLETVVPVERRAVVERALGPPPAPAADRGINTPR
jgi:hypothetical protein